MKKLPCECPLWARIDDWLDRLCWVLIGAYIYAGMQDNLRKVLLWESVPSLIILGVWALVMVVRWWLFCACPKKNEKS